MDSTTIVIAAVCLLVGVAVGALLTRTLSPQEKKRKELDEKLRQKENELKIYQQDVSEHFLKTAELVKEMTRSQREISEQLATGAMRLTSMDVSRRVQDAAFAELSADSRPRIYSATPPEAPKDYAPTSGVLSENYGFTDFPKKAPPIEVSSLNTGKIADKTDNDLSDDDDPTLKVS